MGERTFSEEVLRWDKCYEIVDLKGKSYGKI